LLTAIESVWEQIKQAAHQYASSGAPLDMREAEATVVKFLRQANVTPWPSADVIEFYANELMAHVERDRFTVQ
jgi:hypothetical protein